VSVHFVLSLAIKITFESYLPKKQLCGKAPEIRDPVAEVPATDRNYGSGVPELLNGEAQAETNGTLERLDMEVPDGNEQPKIELPNGNYNTETERNGSVGHPDTAGSELPNGNYNTETERNGSVGHPDMAGSELTNGNDEMATINNGAAGTPLGTENRRVNGKPETENSKTNESRRRLNRKEKLCGCWNGCKKIFMALLSLITSTLGSSMVSKN
jgi:hypothetical protein